MSRIDLHVHPFLGNKNLVDVVGAMEYQDLDIIAVESLDASIYPQVISDAKKFYSNSMITPEGIRLRKGRYILNAREYNTKENLHILTVGYSMDEATPRTEIRNIIDNGIKNNALIILGHSFVDNGKTRTAGHISDDLSEELEELCKEYSGQIALEWNSYCIPWMRKGLQHWLNFRGIETKYYDVNKKAEELSESLRNQGYNVPIIADTDLHAGTKKDLKHMGTSRIIMDTKGITPREVIDSMRKNIFDGNYRNDKKYVDFSHLMGVYCLPFLLSRFSK